MDPCLEGRVDVEGVEDRLRPLGARDHADVGDAGVEGRDERGLLAEAVRCDEEGIDDVEVGAGVGLDVVAERRADNGHRIGDGAGALDVHDGRGEHRLHEDLQGAAGEAGIVDDGLSGLIRLGIRGDAEKHGVATLHEFEALGANRCLRALPADEALDRAIHEDECLIAGLCGGGLLGKNDAGVHEWDSIGSKPLCPLVQRPRRHG
ncbi:unannotated protein [freshwater metagenome]|uniref:Unannotated protein n=1 Tax=freshwater metagenome TaxID=449393 RepID=A0A6J6STU1_9ZZZZ